MSDVRDLSGATRVPPLPRTSASPPPKSGREKNGEHSCAAVILAAGEALRMGVAKPTLPFGDTTLVGAVVTTARDAGLDPVIVVVGFHGDEVAAVVGGSANVVRNPDPGRGNMSSFVVGLEAVGDADAVVVLLSDMPLVTASTIEAMCRGLLASGAPCGWTHYSDGRGHPIAFTPAGVKAIAGLAGTKALWPYFDSLRHDQRYELSIDETRPPDINTPDDYQELTTQRSTENGKTKNAAP